MKNQFRLVPKMISPNCADIWFMSGGNNENGTIIARILFPADGQLNDNLKALEDTCSILRTRIRRSVM